MAHKLKRWAWIALLCSISCAAPEPPAPKVAFVSSKDGVFVDPLAMVESPDDDFLPSVSNKGGRIAYTAKVAGNLEIFVRNTEGGGAQRLTTHSTDDTDPAFSPDGKRIAWVSFRDDVKGDIWLMDVNGSSKQRLTDRDTSDRAPLFSGDGRTLYFTTLPEGTLQERIDSLELESGIRKTVVERGWDPAPAPGGKVLFYAAHDAQSRPRVFAKHLGDGRTAAVTDGAYIEGMPRAVQVGNHIQVLFTRFADDQNNDGLADADDAPSLWSVRFDPKLFDGEPPQEPLPLTAGTGGEIFAVSADNWIVYTAAGFADLDLYALPVTGMVKSGVAHQALLEAARAADDSGRKRLALRYIVATAKELEGFARYELARELAERGKWQDAQDELARVVEKSTNAELTLLAQVETERLSILAKLEGRLQVRDGTQAAYVQERLQKANALARQKPDSAGVQARAETLRAEGLMAFNKRGEATKILEALQQASTTPAEDAARALDRLSEMYESLGDQEAVARVGRAVQTRFPGERYYVRRCAERWVQAALNAKHRQPLSALETILREEQALAPVAARAAMETALILMARGDEDLAEAQLLELTSRYPNEREILAEALPKLGVIVERSGRAQAALDAYERLLAQFGDSPALRALARRGIVRIALASAQAQERAGQPEEARKSYVRLLRNDPELVVAIRRHVALSAQLGKLPKVLQKYKAKAQKEPLNRLARYGYGYALTFVSPVPMADAEREIEAALALDPRFAAAHLSQGFLAMLRERNQPGKGWLEKAAQSFATTLRLSDEGADLELVAAANLNLGNALVGIGTTDQAFEAYLAREQSTVPFDNKLTEILFRESLARVALREGILDIALDQSRLANQLSQALPNKPRFAATLALTAAASLLAERYQDALQAYAGAADLYRQSNDNVRLVPLLRGQAIAAQALGDDDLALQCFTEIVAIVARGDGPPDPPSSIFITELPGNPRNVTRAVYGFTAAQEEELAETLMGRALARRGDITRARALDQKRQTLLRTAIQDSRQATRIKLELLTALNESARLARIAGAYQQADERLREALGLAVSIEAYSEAATLTNSLQSLWVRHPKLRQPEDDKLLSQVATTADAAQAEHPLAAQRLKRFLALEQFYQATRPMSLTNTLHTFSGALDTLETRGKVAQQAHALAQQSGDVQLAAHLAAYAGLPVDSEASQTPAANASTWRLLFDQALSQPHNETLLTDAIAAFENLPQPALAPERQAFLAAATRALLASNQNERVMRLLERDRLLRMSPPKWWHLRSGVEKSWHAVRNARADATRYEATLKSASQLTRALEGAPISLTSLQAVVGDATLLQAYALSSRSWVWFVVTREKLDALVTATPTQNELPESVAKALALGDSRSTLFVDTGELFEGPAAILKAQGVALSQRFDVVEVLSATYLAAALEQRNLARAKSIGLLAVPASTQALVNEVRGAQWVHFSIVGEEQETLGVDPRYAQVVFSEDAKGTRLALDTLAGLDLTTGVVVADRLPKSVRAQRGFAQAMLLAGVPTVITSAVPLTSVENISKTLETGRVVEALRDLPTNHVRMLGDAGLNPQERLSFAYNKLLQEAGAAGKAFKAAQAAPSDELWLDTKTPFLGLLDAIAFLRQPDNAQRITQLGDAKILALLPRLAKFALDNESNLAKVHQALNEVDEATRLIGDVIAKHQAEGRAKEAMLATLDLGRTLSTAKRTQDAADAFARCMQLARDAKEQLTLADCQSRLGSERRTLFDYAGARTAYEGAAGIYRDNNHPNQVYPTRYLGFLFESGFNDYEQALAKFTQALEAAERLLVKDQVPSLLLDIARVHRQRGDYEKALVFVGKADEKVVGDSAQAKSEVALEAAKIYWFRGNYRRALERQKLGLDFARQARSSFLEIQALSLDGLIALNQGDLVRAERAIGQALDLSRMTQRSSEEAAQLNNLGTVLRESGRLEEATARFKAALAIDTTLNSLEGKAFDLRNLAVTLSRQGNQDEALTALDQALSLSRAVGNRYNELQCLLARAEALEIKRDASATGVYEAAAQLAKELSVPEVEWRSLYGLGRIAESTSIEEARLWLAKALDVAERLGRGKSEGKSVRSRDDLYDDALRLATNQGDTAAVFTLIERSRARNLLDVLATRTLALQSTQAKNLLEGEFVARELEMTAQRSVQQGHADADNLLAKAKSIHVAAEAALRQAFPQLWRAFTIAPPSLQEFQTVLPKDALVLTYFVGRNETTVLRVTYNQAEVVRLPEGHDALQATVSTLTRKLRTFANVDNELATLAHLVAKPAQDTLEGKRVLTVVPHGPLLFVPFMALPIGGKTLLETLAVSSSLSLASLFDDLAKPKGSAPKSVAAFAPATDLPFARLEARAVAPKNNFTGAMATEAELRALRVDALDIAAHAQLDDADPLASAVVLSPHGNDDGRVEVREVFGLERVPDLVTLSACNSLGTSLASDAWAGLAQAFLTAGSRTVVATQNRVSDAAAALVIKRFYRALGTQSRAEALRTAALAAKQYYPHPSHWASFVLLGNFR